MGNTLTELIVQELLSKEDKYNPEVKPMVDDIVGKVLCTQAFKDFVTDIKKTSTSKGLRQVEYLR